MSVLVAALAFSLSACTSSTYRCSNNTCTVTLKGNGADTKVKNVTIAFKGVADGKATFTFDGADVTCAQGDSQDVKGVKVTCTKVEDGELGLSLEG